MSLMTNMVILMLCINIALTIGGVQLGGGDLLTKFVTIDDTTGKVGVSSDLNASLPTSLEGGSISSGTSIISAFIDTVKMIGGFIFLILSIVLAPFIWPQVLGFPGWLQLLFVPYGVAFVLSIIYLIRGWG